jgi:hypothetical protein
MTGNMTGNRTIGDVSWRELYESAMLELDHVRLQSRINAAQVAILQSMQELRGKGQAGDQEEIHALSEALGNLQTLERVESGRAISAGSQRFTPPEGSVS